MTMVELTIDSILRGHQPAYHAGGEGQYLSAQAIDPEQSVGKRASGHIHPIGYATFSGAGPSGAPAWIETDPHDQNTYAYMSDGELISYNSTLAGESVIGTPTSGAGNGMAYMNDNLLLATPTDISIYGQLSGSPSISNTWWTSTAGLTALTNTTYPATRNFTYPNHHIFPHTDGKAYVCDYNGTQGLIHKIGITAAGANSGSAYSVLDLPTGVRPFGIGNYGNDLAVVGSVLGSSTTVRQGNSALFLWDTIEDSFYRQIPVPVPLVTAVKNVNGRLIVVGGSIDFGWQVMEYDGGYGFATLYESREGSPPAQGAIDAFGNRIVMGSQQSVAGGGANLFAIGYQNPELPPNALNSIAIVGNLASGSLPIITAVKFAQQAQNTKYPVAGFRTSTDFGLSKYSIDAGKQAFFNGPVWNIGQPFRVREVRVPLTAAIDANTSITPTLYYDDAAKNTALAAINSTNYSTSDSHVTYSAVEIEDGTIGRNNLYIGFNFGTGTSTNGVGLPVRVTIELLED